MLLLCRWLDVPCLSRIKLYKGDGEYDPILNTEGVGCLGWPFPVNFVAFSD